MIIRQFLQWAQTASPGQRAQGVGALARAYLYADLDTAARDDAEQVLTQFLDDSSPLVRRAMAEALAHAPDAPHHIVLALADDQSDISSIVLARSPLLTDSELIDCAAIADPIAQSAIALRPHLSAAVAASLAEIGAREALISLAVNPSVELPPFSMHRLVERFGHDGEVREALLGRSSLPAPLRADLVAATARALSDFVTGCDWLSRERAERVMREARDHAHIIIAATSRDQASGPMQLVAHLRGAGQLTASLLLRALLSGSADLFEAALAHLADVPLPRVKGLMRDWRGTGFAALYRKAGLATALLPAFRAAIETLDAPEFAPQGSVRLSRRKIELVLTACKAMKSPELDRLLVVLRRFETEAAREEARDFSSDVLPRVALNSSTRRLAVPPQRRAAAGLPNEPPLLLTDFDAEGEAREASSHYTIDMHALEEALGDLAA